ncbi:hypothetical protein M3A49_15610 [Paraburkholderia sp. CNPSo 3076]|uniref:hypothetical protein n=1 Tax=Paraburkholderia sp. CNPSo 3076 TaxID=2940936 RepID=UPI00224CA2CA|nr:hypothetical protein [Paraburkholderia sp. CNPSo 3076]MCX5540906.1 hypothetical protein [Paraburkholderia sp. CNPSo 3076]
MEPDAISRQQSSLSTTSVPLSGALASGESASEEGADDSEGDPMPAMLSRLSFCVAWLFGLEAFLAESDARARTPRA